MAQEDPNRLVEWYLLAKEQTPRLRRYFATWLEHVREEPSLIWATPAVRYVTYLVGALLAVWIVTGFIHFVQPVPANARPQATTADFHVICVNPECGNDWMINRKFGFRGFPVQCPKCGKKTGMAARRCWSERCKGKWVVPIEEDGKLTCPNCGLQFPD